MSERVAHLQFGRYVHPIYREQLHAVPPGWRYEATHPALTEHTTPTKRVVEQRNPLASVRSLAESAAVRVLGEAGYVHRIRARPPRGTRLVHAAERLLRDSPLPYVLDLEHAELFVFYQRAAFERPWARAKLEQALGDDRLRFLLPWSEAAGRSLMAVLSPAAATAIGPKIRVVRPAIRPAAQRPRRREPGPLRAVFVGTAFYEKGGVEAIRAVQSVRSSVPVTLDVVTYAPPEWATALAREPGVRLHAPGGTDLVQRLYAQADVLLFPSHMDTFGYVVLEAMAHALPVLAPSHLALTETVEDGRSGLLFEPENMLYRPDTRCEFRHVVPPPRHYRRKLERPSGSYVDGIAEALARLASEPGLYDTLSEGAFESVRSGMLSITRRRSLLAEIYDLATV